MSFLALLTQTVTVWRQPATPVDAYGLPTSDWAPVWTGPGRAQPLAGDENRRDRETVDVRFRVFLPADCPIGHTDRLSVGDGQPLNVETVQAWPGRSGTTHHIEAIVQQEVP